VLGIAISGLLGLSAHGVAIVGKVRSGLPTPGVPDVHGALLAAAAGLLLVIDSESLGAAQTFAAKYS
jgi:sulfate permease, SulP family